MKMLDGLKQFKVIKTLEIMTIEDILLEAPPMVIVK
jgi:hypothetical protein